MTRINTNNPPYYDDFDPSKNFHRILVRPEYAIQARELTQMQTIQQAQSSAIGRNLFENGAMVVPGYVSYDLKYAYVKVTSDADSLTAKGVRLTAASDRAAYWLNQAITGTTSGVKAYVVNATDPDDNQVVTLFVRYTGSGITGLSYAFQDGERIQVDSDSASYTYAVPNAATGFGSSATIRDGVYFVHDTFVKVNTQTIILDAYSNTPSYRVGLYVTESVVIPEEDPSLYDNSQGTNDYAAPGAHRLKIDLALVKLDLDTIGESDLDDDFVELLRLENGVPTLKVDKTAYAEIARTMARRTYDQAGDYTVSPFTAHVRNFFNDNTNNGVFKLTAFDFATQQQAQDVSMQRFGVAAPGTWHANGSKFRPGTDDTDLTNMMLSKLCVVLDPGKAYVKGNEIETIANTYVDVDKANTYRYDTQATLNPYPGNIIYIQNIYGMPDIKTHSIIQLRNQMTATRGSGAGSQIGTARVRGLRYLSGTPGVDAVYQLYLFDIQMTGTNKFSQTMQVFCSGANNANGTNFSADVSPESLPLIGQVTKANSSTLTGSGTRWFSSNSDEDLLSVNESIEIVDNRGNNDYFRITATPTNDNLLNVTGPAPVSDNVLNSSFSYIWAELYEPYNNAAVFPLPKTGIKSLRDQSGNVAAFYEVARQYDPITAASGQITISTKSGFNEEFPEPGESTIIAIDLNSGAVVDVAGYLSRQDDNHSLVIGNLDQATQSKSLLLSGRKAQILR